jgi:5-methylcytosine-specific restriction endonuclease McrA
MTRKRAEFTQKTKLEAMARYLRCPGVPEKQRECGKPFGKLSAVQFDHIKRDEIDSDNSPENCRPLCEECHRLKTSGNGATSAGSDTHMAAKGKRLRGETKTKPKAKIANRGFQGWRNFEGKPVWAEKK